MEITFTTLPDLQLKLAYPREFSTDKPLDERHTTRLTEWGNLQFNECWFDGACLLRTEFNVERHASMKLQCDSFCWLMNFVLEGELVSDNSGEQLILLQGKYHTFYCSALDMNISVQQHTKMFTICLTRRFIRKLLGKDLMADQFESGGTEPLTLVASDGYLGGRFSTIIKEILKADQPPYIRRIYLEAKILELLSLQLVNLENNQDVPENFSREDVSRLNEAKQIVAQNLQTPCSLIELARKTGLNDFKLKRGFKTLFGTTVFGYLAELRMETGFQLLKEGKSVNEVAEAVGYKNSQHFTVAFKKKFGMLPSQVAKE